MEISRAEFAETASHWDRSQRGWGPGVRHVTFHLTFPDAPQLHAASQRFAAAAQGLAGVGVVPQEWLHLTMVGLGVASDLDGDRIDRAAAEVFRRAPLGTEPLRFGRLWLSETGVLLAADNVAWLDDLKRVQDEVAAVHGTHPDRSTPREFRPHVTLAYFDGPVDIDELERRIHQLGLDDVAVQAPVLALIDLQRVRGLYSWRTLDEHRLGE